jgi:membrane protein implicated in regulation of membrane protease activity
MKFLASLILIVALSYIGGLFLDWWSVALATFLVALLIPFSAGRALIYGFISVFLLWLALAFFQDVRNDHILANRVSEIFLKQRSPILIGIVSAFIGGLVAGMGGLTGSLLRKALRGRDNRPQESIAK